MARRPATTIQFEDLRREAIEFLERDPAREVRLAEVAAHLSASPRQVQRAFADVGSTLREALTVVRAQRAAQLLQKPTARVAEVAASVGYRQPAHFAKAFRRVYGVSPAKYRSTDYTWAEWHRRRREQRRDAAQEESIQDWAEDIANVAKRRQRRLEDLLGRS
jgi:two-component system response regulator YesN